jgi:HK97 gp10 family phage protein
MAIQSKNNLPRITSQIERALSGLVKKTAFRIEAKAKQDCPVDTGVLRNSIQTHVDNPVKATVGTPLDYAPYVHDGTRHIKGKAFLTEAADTEGAEFQKDVRDIERSLR